MAHSGPFLSTGVKPSNSFLIPPASKKSETPSPLATKIRTSVRNRKSRGGSPKGAGPRASSAGTSGLKNKSAGILTNSLGKGMQGVGFKSSTRRSGIASGGPKMGQAGTPKTKGLYQRGDDAFDTFSKYYDRKKKRKRGTQAPYSGSVTSNEATNIAREKARIAALPTPEESDAPVTQKPKTTFKKLNTHQGA